MKREQIQNFLKAISDPTRSRILNLLKKGELCACQIHPKLRINQNLSSHHLKVLKNLSLITSRRKGVKIIYSRNEKEIKSYKEIIFKTI